MAFHRARGEQGSGKVSAGFPTEPGRFGKSPDRADNPIEAMNHRDGSPAAPVIIGMILGPFAEQNFQAMTISAGDCTVFFTRPLSATLLALAALALFGPKLYQLAVRPKPDHVPGDA